MTSVEIKTAIKDYLEAIVPGLLTAAGLDDFDAYLDQRPDDERERQLCVYLAEGKDTTLMATEAFIVQAQLPREMNPDPYHNELWESAIKKFDPATVGMTSRDLTWLVWNPGEDTDGGSTSFIYYEIVLSKELDDCDY
jgi:hypothetical protein